MGPGEPNRNRIEEGKKREREREEETTTLPLFAACEVVLLKLHLLQGKKRTSLTSCKQGCLNQLLLSQWVARSFKQAWGNLNPLAWLHGEWMHIPLSLYSRTLDRKNSTKMGSPMQLSSHSAVAEAFKPDVQKLVVFSTEYAGLQPAYFFIASWQASAFITSGG